MTHDADAFRAFVDILTVQSPPAQVMARPGLVERGLAIAEERSPMAAPGPTRTHLLELMG